MSPKPWLAAYDPDVPATLNYPDSLIPDIVFGSVDWFPRQTALNFFGSTMTYAELGTAVEQCSRALAAAGVRAGERVVLFLPNSPHFVIAYYAALRIGAVVVPANPMYSEQELGFQTADSGAETLLTLDLLYGKVAAIRADTPLKRVIVGKIQDFLPPLKKLIYPILAQKKTDIPEIEEKNGVQLFGPLMKRTFPAAPRPDISADDLAMLQYTGGTTGIAKGAMLTHRNIVANNLQMRSWYRDLRPGSEVFISVLPFFHSYGMATALNLPLSIGAVMIMFPTFAAKDVLKAVQQHRATVFPGIPSIYTVLNNYKDIKRYDISTINYCISGAAPLPVAVLEDFERVTGGIIVEGYGLSEASPVTHCNPLKRRRKSGSIGVPLPDTDCRVLDIRTGHEVPEGEVGELCIRGPQVMQGYWNNAEETAATLQDGWLRTGDMARSDTDGYFYIAERKKDMIISEGFNIYPREVEEFLMRHGAIADAAVVGAPDALRGERVLAYVVPRPGHSPTVDELMGYCREHLVKYKVPKKIQFVDEIPTTIAGKKLRRKLRQPEADPA